MKVNKAKINKKNSEKKRDARFSFIFVRPLSFVDDVNTFAFIVC